MKKNLGILISVGLALATVARADVYGSDPTVPLPTLDTCAGCIFAYVDFPGTAAGETVLSYSFFAGAPVANDPVVGNEITPLLLEDSGGIFTIIGIGTTRTIPAANTTLSYSFGLVSGTQTIVDGNTYFGYLDGSPSGAANQGTITMNLPTGGGPGMFFGFPPPAGIISVGDTPAFLMYGDIPTQPPTRTYSLNVTAPEAGLYSIYGAFAAGLIGLFVGIRRRKIA